MQLQGLPQKIVSGLTWTYLERLLNQGVSVLVTIILARLLLPEDYGIISIVTVFITVCDALVVGGFSDTLIQKKDADQRDFSTMFWFTLILGCILYGVVYAAAPWVEHFFNDTPMVCSTLRVMAIRLPINAVQSIQSALISKRMEYRYFFFATLLGTLISAVLGISLAYNGYGVWALVAQFLSSSIIGTMCIWFTYGWRPDWTIDRSRLKALYSKGWKMQCSSLIASLYGELESICIGRKYTTADLAYYDKGKQFPKLIMQNVQLAIGKVMLSAFSEENDNKAVMKAMARRSVKLSVFVLTPLLLGMIACAEELVSLVLTEKWMPAVPFLRMVSLYYLLQPMMVLNKQIVIASGETKLYLQMEIIKKAIGITLLFAAITMSNSVLMITVASFVTQCIGLLIQSFPLGRLIDYPLREQIGDYLPIQMNALIMFLIVLGIGFIPLGLGLKLLLKVLVGIVVYVSVSLVTKNESFLYLWGLIHRLCHSRKG